MKTKFLVVFEAGTTSYGAFAPDIPGCVAAGESLEEVRALYLEAVDFHLEEMVKAGETMPSAITSSVDFAGEDPEHGVSHCVVEWLEIEIPVQQNLAISA